MSCLCEYLTPERLAAAGVEMRDMVCIFCSKAGLSFPTPTVPEVPPEPLYMNAVQRRNRRNAVARAAALARLASSGSLGART